MKKLVIRLLIFAALVVVLDVLVGLFLQVIHQKARGREIAEPRYVIDQTSEDLLILGSSRAKTHYNPAIFEDSLGLSCFNCGWKGEGIINNYGVFQMIQKRYTPKVIIYDVYVLFDLLQESRNQFNVLKLYGDREEVTQEVNEIDPLERLKLRSQMYRYNYQWAKLLVNLLQNYDLKDKGFQPYIGEADPNKLPPPPERNRKPNLRPLKDEIPEKLYRRV